MTGARRGSADGLLELARSDRVDAFVQRHFTWPGSLRLHRAALGADIVRAPANLLLSPILVVARAAGWLCQRLRLRRAARWLAGRRILLGTAVAARVEAAILTEILGAPPLDVPFRGDRDAVARAILAAPPLRQAILCAESPGAATAMADRIAGVLADYTVTRSAMAEIVTALLTLMIGAVAFQALTPGMISMAPGLAEAVSRSVAIADFPLGEVLGGLWYGVFPVGPSPWLVAATGAALLLLGSVLTAFAGVLADPVQARLGLHRRRLLRLLRRVEEELAGSAGAPVLAHEHILARVFDLWDAALSMLRLFRG